MDKFVIFAFERLLKLLDIFQMHALAKQLAQSQASWVGWFQGVHECIYSTAMHWMCSFYLIKWGKFWLSWKTVHNIWIWEFVIWLWLKWLSRPKYWLIGRRKYGQQKLQHGLGYSSKHVYKGSLRRLLSGFFSVKGGGYPHFREGFLGRMIFR